MVSDSVGSGLSFVVAVFNLGLGVLNWSQIGGVKEVTRVVAHTLAVSQPSPNPIPSPAPLPSGRGPSTRAARGLCDLLVVWNDPDLRHWLAYVASPCLLVHLATEASPAPSVATGHSVSAGGVTRHRSRSGRCSPQ